jgi:hypothetical protein
MPKRIGRPVIRARLPRSLYPTAAGESVYEFEIPGTAGMLRASGLITLTRHVDGRCQIAVTKVDEPALTVVGPVMDPNLSP